MFRILYSLLLGTLWPFYQVLSWLSPKIRIFKKSRQTGERALRSFLRSASKEGRLYWLHGASVGEIDQALALARTIRQREPDARILLSAFSLSVKIRELERIDLFFSMPLDFLHTWRRVFRAVPLPDIFISMTWDVFPNLIAFLGRKSVACYLCSASLSEQSWRLQSPWRQWLRSVYAGLQGIGTVDEANRKRFMRLHPNPDKVQSTGDSRFDTIFHKIEHTPLQADYSSWLRSLARRHTEILILASTYSSEEEALIPWLPELLARYTGLAVLIFPHQIDLKHISEIEDRFRRASVEYQKYSLLKDRKNSQGNKSARVYLMDCMGLLALSYAYSSFCYVGGGFGKRVHNVAEPAALGNAVLTGPNIDWSGIALALESRGLLLRCPDADSLKQAILELLSDASRYRRMGASAQRYLEGLRGASDRFYEAFLQ